MGLKVHHNEFYNHNDVWFDSRYAYISKNGLNIECVHNPVTHSNWQFTNKKVNFKSCMVETVFSMIYGIWEIEARLCDSWPAIWLLRKGGIIIPEVDIMEVMHGYFKPAIHYCTPDNKDGHAKHQAASKVCKYDEKLHKFACELLPGGYRIYIDRILVVDFKDKHPEFTSPEPCYLLLNNADTGGNNNTKMVIESVKAYKN